MERREEREGGSERGKKDALGQFDVQDWIVLPYFSLYSSKT